MAQISTIARFEVSGEILNEDVLSLLAIKDAGVPGAEMDKKEEEVFYAAWDLLREQWQTIRTEVGQFDTTRLRNRWIKPLLELLGHDLDKLRAFPAMPNGETVPISHRTEQIPIWLTEYAEKPDDPAKEGRRRRSKHDLFQEYLDLTEDDWGILCGGRTIRLLTDYHKTLTRNFVEADLESIFDELDVDAFRIVWRLFRASAFVPKAKGVRDIERVRDHARQQGTEIGKELRKQVVEAVITLANGFLEADETGDLRRSVQHDSDGPMKLYQSVLRVVYRLLFLLYVENKPGWTPAQDPRWASGYSVSRLRALAEDPGSFRAEGEDLWEGLKVTFRIIRDGSTLFNDEIKPYGGELFDDERLWLLGKSPLPNGALLRALYLLTIFERKERKATTIHRVNFRNLRIDALGSVYEALLDISPVVKPDGSFAFGEGAERKLSGTYYTPRELVTEVINEALIPVIEDRIKGLEGLKKEEALLDIKVVDPACGSGAFLIQAVDALAIRLCDIRRPGEPPSDKDLRAARRDVVTRCIHGVDLNSMAVELCKFTLWLSVAHPDLPLSYLEPIILCGNALVGIPLKSQVEREKKRLAEERITIQKRTDLTLKQKSSELKKLQYVGWPDSVPDDAFNAVTGDEADYAKSLKKRNREEREGQGELPLDREERQDALRTQKYLQFKASDENSIAARREKVDLYERWRSDEDTRRRMLEADFWCSAFFCTIEDGDEAPTHRRFRELKDAHASVTEARYDFPILVEQAKRMAARPDPANPQSGGIGLFHWELEFPDVEAQGGFDCVLGNPPWERIKLQENEFFGPLAEHPVFGSHARAIVNATNKGGRERLIARLSDEAPSLLAAFTEAKHRSECEAKFVRMGGCYPLTAVGDVNTYALFSERARDLTCGAGRAGLIVQAGLVTDDTLKRFFSNLVSSRSLHCFLGMDNEGAPPIFRGITDRMKFGLVVMSAPGSASDKPIFTSQVSQVVELSDTRRRFAMSDADFGLLNPNTLTCPVFRTQVDAELTKLIYRRVPVLVNEVTGEDPWGVKFLAMFHMSNDSGAWFEEPGHLEQLGFRLKGNVYRHNGQNSLPDRNPKNKLPYDSEYLPLFEAKMVHHFDHRYGTYEGASATQLGEGELPKPGEDWKRNPDNVALPRYWVSKQEVLLRTSRVPPSIKDAIRQGNEQMAVLVLLDWLAGWLLNSNQIKDVERGKQAILAIFGGSYGDSHWDAYSRWMTSLMAQATEREFPITEIDRGLMATSSSGLEACRRLLEHRADKWMFGFRDVTSAVVERTAIGVLQPSVAFGNNLPLLAGLEKFTPQLQACFAANFSALAFDYPTRQKINGAHMNFFLVKQLPVLPPDSYTESDIALVSRLVLQLSYTSNDMRRWANAMGYEGEPFIWNDEERAILRAELDAYFARLYGLNRKQLRYILDPHGLSHAELEDITNDWEDPTCAGPHLLPAAPALDFPGETFRVLKEKEEKKYGEYRTRRLVLEAWDRLWQELGPVKPLPIRYGPNAPRSEGTPDPAEPSTPQKTGRLLDTPIETGLFSGDNL